MLNKSVHIWLSAFAASLFLVGLSIYPSYLDFKKTPPGHVFLGTHNNSLDYPMFVAAIHRGQSGLLCNKAVFTSEKQPCDFVHWIYIPWGFVTGLLGIDAITSYHLARAFFGLTLALSTFYFIKTLFTRNTPLVIGAFLLALFSAGFTRTLVTQNPVINEHNLPPIKLTLGDSKIYFLGPHLDWWTGGDVLRRAAFQPHAMLKNSLLLLIIALFAKTFTQKKLRASSYLLLPGLGLLLGLHDPINTISIFVLLAGYLLFLFIKRKPNTPKMFFPVLLYILISTIGLFATLWAFTDTPWKSVSDWEATQFRPVQLAEYAKHIGPLFYLGIPGLITLALSKRHNRFLSFASVVLAFGAMFAILVGISRYLGISFLRFFQTPVHIFLAIGAAYLTFYISSKVAQVIADRARRREPAAKIAGVRSLKVSTALAVASPSLIYWILITTILAVTLPAYPVSIFLQKKDWNPSVENYYPTRESFDAIYSLKKNSTPDDVVVSNSAFGQIIPAISGNTVFIGHQVSTVNYPQKLKQTQKFFSGAMSFEEAQDFLISTQGKFIIATPEESRNLERLLGSSISEMSKSSKVNLYEIMPKNRLKY